MDLPKINIVTQVTNPKWTITTGSRDIIIEDNKLTIINPNGEPYYIDMEIEAEVLTVHLAKNTMRIRYVWEGRKETRDVSADIFFENFKLIPVDPPAWDE